jgi:orotidine-5'-phosphate decarboxylase
MTEPLIVAMDVEDDSAAFSLARQLENLCDIYKIGPGLFLKHGAALVEKFRWMDKKVFLDLKFHDIPATVERAVREAGRTGVYSLTVHASGGSAMIQAAVAVKPRPKIWAVTILTSLSDADLETMGIANKVSEQAVRLALLAKNAGADGVICSVNEAARIRQECGKNFTIVTPGIRQAGTGVHDQKRVATASAAREAGANFFVVGRPVLEAKDPKKIVEELRKDWNK